jgi:uncharacterized protein YidB (DUF937 family)
MSLLNILLGAAAARSGGLLGQRRGGGKAALIGIVLSLLASQRGGGLRQLGDLLRQRGMGQRFNSWVGTGANEAVSPGEVNHLLGDESIDQLAQQTGMPREEVSSNLAELMPQIVDQLTPDGQIPDDATLEQRMPELERQLSV